MTAFSGRSPSDSRAHSASSRRITAEISGGVKLLPPSITVSWLPILRLILRTVRSGYKACWLRAGSPTSSSPDAAKPTQEGNIRWSPGPSTPTRPSTNAATSEFVVPKSIPTIRSFIFLLRRSLTEAAPSLRVKWRTGYFHLRWTKYLVIPFVTASVDFEHGAGRNRCRFLALDCVHAAWIQTLAPTPDFPRIEVIERLIQTLDAQFVTPDQSAQRIG